ncbi:hypothetical protein [Alkalihalobacterium sp. APHAB7]
MKKTTSNDKQQTKPIVQTLPRQQPASTNAFATVKTKSLLI